MPWLPAAAFALGALPTIAVAQDRTINAPTTVSAEEATAQDTEVVAGGSVTVTGTGWLKAEDFVTSQNVTIDAGGLLSTQIGGAMTPAPFSGIGNYTVTGGATTVDGELFVGSTRDLSGNPNPVGPPLAGFDGPIGTLAVDAGSVLTGAGGTITANAAVLTNSGVAGATGAGSTFTFSGTATVNTGGILGAASGGAVTGTTLALTGGGDATVFDTNSTFDLTGAATVDGPLSDLLIGNGGAFTGNTLALTNEGAATVGGTGSTFDLTGAATVDGNASLLAASAGGAFTGTTLALTGGGDATVFDTSSTFDLTGAATVDGAGSDLLALSGGAFTGTTLALTNQGAVTIRGLGSTFDLTGAATVDGTFSELLVDDSGAFTGTTLALTDNGDATVTGAGSTFDLSGAATVDGTGSLLRSQNSGALTGTTLALTNDGDASVTGAGSTFNLTGAATVDGVGSDLFVLNEGGFFGTTLALTNSGDAFVDAAGSTLTLTGAATVDGAASNLFVQTDGDFFGTTLAVTNNGDAFVTGTGSTLNLTGAATVDGVGSNLFVQFGGAFNGTTLALTDQGNTSVDGAGSTLTLTDAATVDGAGSTLSAQNGGAFNAASATQSGGLIDVRTASAMTYTGDVTVNGGTTHVDGTLTAANLLINGGGLLTGAGTVVGDLTASGRIAVGNSPGVMTVAGNYVGNGQTFDVEVQGSAAPVAGTDYDQLAVTGTATVDGGTVNVLPFGNQNYTLGARYEFLTAAGGLTVVNPVAVNQNVAGARFAQLIGPNFYALVVARANSGGVARTFNQRAVAGGLAASAGDPALARLRDAIDTLTDDAAAREALDGLSGELYGTQLTALNRSGLQFLDVVGRGGAFPLVCGACGVNGAGQRGLQGWIDSYGAGGRVDGDANAARAELGTAGVAVGLSQIFGGSEGCLALGGFYGYESNTTRVPGVASTVTDELHRVGGSARASLGQSYASLTGFGGVTEGASRRSIVIDNPLFPFADSTTGAFDGSQSGADAELGTLFGSPTAYLSPVLGVRYVQTRRDAFTESGGAAALAVDEESLKELRARVGLRAGRRFALTTALPATATFAAFYSRDLSAGTTGDARARFAAAPGSDFVVRGTDFTADRVTLAPGLSLGEGPVRLTTQYQLGLSEASVLHSGDVRVEICY
ncbi:hypothetical protein LzC2_36590 [Planctomycetes bacterium LzC2]|uniref:Autotransporter domain-containing protein n=1 Tax=Alienimonas chondri TaxID=2681879 RepID=A0ABX1VHH4_9PLAN|nr:hypothetical protein [Alienimonas chondri]